MSVAAADAHVVLEPTVFESRIHHDWIREQIVDLAEALVHRLGHFARERSFRNI